MLEMSRFIWRELRWRTSGDTQKAFEDTSAPSLCITYENVFAWIISQRKLAMKRNTDARVDTAHRETILYVDLNSVCARGCQ